MKISIAQCMLLLVLVAAGCAPMAVPTGVLPTATPLPPTSTPPPPTATPQPSETPTAAPTATATIPPPTATRTATPTPVPPIDLQLWLTANPDQQAALNSLLAKFNATHPDIRAVARYPATNADLLAGVTSGDMPDLILAYQSDIAPLAKKGTVVPLDEMMQDPRFGFGADDGDVLPAFIDRYPALNNKVYSLGFMRSMQVMYYNAGLLRAAGFSKPPESWDEFAKICAAVSKPPDVYCYEMAPDASTFAGWVLSRGGELFSADGKSVAFDSQAGLDALTLLNDLYRKRQAVTATRALQEPSDLAAGKVAFTFDSTTGLAFYDKAIENATKKIDWAIAPLPHSTVSPILDAYGPSLAIGKTTTARQQAAFVLLKWLMDKEPNAEWVRTTGYFPARQSAKSLLAAYIAAHRPFGNALDWCKYSRGEPALAAWDPIRWYLAEAMTAVAGGKAKPEDALQEAARKATAALAAQ